MVLVNNIKSGYAYVAQHYFRYVFINLKLHFSKFQS